MLLVGGQADAGAGFNVVPGSAWFSLDRRFNPDEELDQELARLTSLIDRAAPPAPRSRSRSCRSSRPGSTDEDHPEAQRLARCVEAVEGAAPPFRALPRSARDALVLRARHPRLRLRRRGLDVAHGPHEYIDEAAMRRCAAVYALFAGS